MVTVTPESDDSRVLVQAERDLGFEGQPSTFDENFWTTFQFNRCNRCSSYFENPSEKTDVFSI
jgi:hypothetical protein